MKIIEFKDVDISFKNGKKIFSGKLNFDVNKSQVTLLKGGIGTGKSTLLRIIAGLNSLYDIKTSDGIFINSLECTELERRKVVNYIGQEAEKQFLTEDGLYELIFGLENRNISKNIIFDKYKSIINKFKISENIINTKTSLLSGGEKRKLALLSSLITDESIFLLDEPLAMLDYANSKRIVDFINMYKEECSFIIATHEEKFDFLADNILIIDKGIVKYE